MKTCTRCGELKSAFDFYRNRKAPDGRQYTCKECDKSASNAHRWANIEHRRAYDRARGLLPSRKAVVARSVSDYQKKNPDRIRANNAANRAFAAGKIALGPCEVCGTLECLVKHHDSYKVGDELKIRWLCQAHHKQWHRDNEVRA